MGKVIHHVAMSGATGFVGSYLNRFFQKLSWKVTPLGRKDFSSGLLAEKMKGTDIVVNLAGAPVISRWTEENKKIMYESRVNTTRSIVSAYSRMDQKPKVFISTSAVGYYANGGPHTENDHVKADSFLGRLAQDWEREALKAGKSGIRTVIFRFGVVLGRDGGALKQMMKPFRLGLGGSIGKGTQPFSWIHIVDLMRAFQTAIEDDSYEGIYNLTSPHPSTNRGLTEALGKALGKPTRLKIPEFVLRLQFGEGAQVLTEGQHVLPERFLKSGFSFSFTDIEEAIRDCVAR